MNNQQYENMEPVPEWAQVFMDSVSNELANGSSQRTTIASMGNQNNGDDPYIIERPVASDLTTYPSYTASSTQPSARFLPTIVGRYPAATLPPQLPKEHRDGV